MSIVKKTSILYKTIYGFDAIPIKHPVAVFTEIEKKNYKIYMQYRRTPILRKKNGVGGLTVADLKTQYETQ